MTGSETALIPGGRDVRGTLDGSGTGTENVVVACPPHPQHRGHRGDERLVAVADALNEDGIDCLRFDYGEWDEGRGELIDAQNALDWAAERYDSVGVFGFSFGGAIALLAAAAARDTVDPVAVSALAPAARLPAGLDAAAALYEIRAPVQVVYATRDKTAEWEPVVDRARELGCGVVGMEADHFFIGQSAKVAETVSGFLTSEFE
ncbi:dienelactone hydrolase family protein [Haloprofundus halobius]|uniref:dienelactone hydrolase family protein n=1 Tax=Haloprofundus halobius TaxID=2876194 RepID=UPI001CCC7DB4|nr:dienelactone hydrolase family protein [Haloprofundus halobius]